MQLVNYFMNAPINIINKIILMPKKTHMQWNNFDKQQMTNRTNSKKTHVTLLLLDCNVLMFIFNIYIYKYLYFVVSIIVNILKIHNFLI